MVENRTSIPLDESTRERIKELMPYSSISYDEFLTEMADVYEQEVDHV